MRIGVNTRMLLKNRLEGIGRFTFETVKRMVESHPEDQFIFFFDRPFDDSFVFAENVTPVVLSPPARHPILHFVWFEWAIKRALNKYKVDVFYSPDGYLSLRSDVPTLMVSHDIAYKHYPDHMPLTTLKYYEYFVPRFHRRAEHIVAVSSATKLDLLDKLDVDTSKISIGHNSCTPKFKVLTEEEKALVRNEYADGKPYFVYVGSIHPRKNIANLLRAFEMYCDNYQDDTQLFLVGRWAWKTEEIKAVYENSKVKDRIIRLEHVTDELPRIMASAKAMIYVSLFEGFGIPVLEAMYCDIPVITSNLSSMPEVAGDAALMVDPHSLKDISKAMTTISTDPKLVEDLIKKGQLQRQKFDWQKTADHIYGQLNKIRK